MTSTTPSPPLGQWHVVMEENFQDLTYDVYIQRTIDEDGTREVMIDADTIQTVSPGVKTPVWMKASSEFVRKSDFFNIFKHVYILRNTWEEYGVEPEPGPAKEFVVIVSDVDRGAQTVYGPHPYDAALVLKNAIEDLHRRKSYLTVEMREMK